MDDCSNQAFPSPGTLRHGYIVIPFARILPDILKIRLNGISVKDLVRLWICFSDDLQGLCVDDIPELILTSHAKMTAASDAYQFPSIRGAMRSIIICPFCNDN